MTPRQSVLLVADGETPHVLAAVRSLGRAGFPVGVASPAGSAYRGAWSRFAVRRHDAPRVDDDLDGYLAAVREAVDRGGYDVVLPGDDADLMALSWGRDGLGALLPVADHRTVTEAVDKLALVRLAEQVGLGVPRTVAADDAAAADIAPPLVVKARWHWRPEVAGEDRHVYAVECDSRADVEAAVADMRAAGAAPLLQERIDGKLTATSALVGRSGELLAASQQETDRLSLRRTSVLARTVPVDADHLERVRLLLASIGWWGLANLQFLLPADGRPRLIDFNGRFYGSLALAVRAGADFPALWVRDALGERVGGPWIARPEVQFQALEEDLRRARRERRGGLGRDLARALTAAPGSVHTTLSISDPWPAMRQGARLVRESLRRSGEQAPDGSADLSGNLRTRA
jgi:predicted ATP-grasp superfamily ATP-dependent carboligase